MDPNLPGHQTPNSDQRKNNVPNAGHARGGQQNAGPPTSAGADRPCSVRANEADCRRKAARAEGGRLILSGQQYSARRRNHRRNPRGRHFQPAAGRIFGDRRSESATQVDVDPTSGCIFTIWSSHARECKSSQKRQTIAKRNCDASAQFHRRDPFRLAIRPVAQTSAMAQFSHE